MGDAFSRRLAVVLLASLSFLAVPGDASQALLRVELQLEPPHLDPTLTASSTVAEALHLNVFQGLTRIGRHGEVQPALASRWEVSEDGLVYRFVLRSDVLFHHGKAFDSGVAAYSLRRLLEAENANPQRHLFRAIRHVEEVGTHELRIELEQPDALLPFRLALSAAVIVHPDTVHTNRTHPVGTGPYRFVGWERKEGVRLRVFEAYWGELPAIREALFTFTPNRVELENLLSEGAIDLYPDASSLTAHMPLMQRADYEIQDGLSEGEVLLAMNHGRALFQDIRVRRALSHAVDREALLAIYPSIDPPLIGSHFSPRHPAYVDLSQRYPHDPERALELLTEAGVAGKARITLTIPPTQYAEQSSLYIASDLEAVGFEVELQRVSWGEWLRQVFTERDYDVTVIAHVEPMDIDIYARDDYYFNYHSETFRELWSRIEAQQDPAERHRLLAEAQRHLAEEAVHVFLFLKPQQAIRKSNLQGVWSDAPIPAVVLEELYWE